MKRTVNVRDVLAMFGVFVLALVVAGRIHPQDGKGFEPTENQKLRLKVQQLNFSIAQEHFQQAAASFNAEVKAVEKENSWPETLAFDPNTLAFAKVPPAPAPPKATIPITPDKAVQVPAKVPEKP